MRSEVQGGRVRVKTEVLTITYGGSVVIECNKCGPVGVVVVKEKFQQIKSHLDTHAY